MRVIFMGTPDFATGTLEEIVKAGHEVVGVVTQPDKPKGRGKTMMPTPVKETALKYDLPVYQPKKVRESEFVELLRSLNPDVMVVAAFGQIITKEILDMPKYGCINVHASLLPAYRGAAPIQWAVINGDKESGVTIMQMDEGIDTGDMIEKAVVPIAEDETGGSLFDKLSHTGAKLCVKVLKDLEEGTAVREKQPEESTTPYAKMIDKKMGEVDWKKSAKEIEQLIRGLNPWPSAYTKVHGKTLKIWKANVLSETSQMNPGQIARVTKDGFAVQTGQGILEIQELQLEGKKRMDTSSFLRGYPLAEGECLG
nr:methionyl-tRNA formyltransferase [uncultured Blautia sp.]